VLRKLKARRIDPEEVRVEREREIVKNGRPEREREKRELPVPQEQQPARQRERGRVRGQTEWRERLANRMRSCPKRVRLSPLR
jgi:hypothetical protein